MWRKNKSLEYRLFGRPKSEKPNHASERNEKSQGKVWLWKFKSRVQFFSLEIDTDTANLDAELAVAVQVEDGLGSIGFAPEPVGRGFMGAVHDSNAVYETDLIETARVLPLELPDNESVKTRQALLSIIPYSRSIRMGLGPVPVYSPRSVKLRTPLIGGNGGILPKSLSVGARMQKIANVPFQQNGIDPKTLPESEYEGYLQEAVQVKGIPADKCELIALFRHIPIELITKLHFLSDEKKILYSVQNEHNRSRTTVYELMVIREKSGKKVHLIPHRTRNRAVVLNQEE